MDSSLEVAYGNTEFNDNKELPSACPPVTMNLTADQDGILQLVENENDSPQVPRRDDESEHQEGRKEHIEKRVIKTLDFRKRTRICQENQAERMLKRRRSELQPEVGNGVTGDAEMQGTSLVLLQRVTKMTSTGLE